MPQLSKGVEIRAQIDNEQIRSLLLINGGGAIALIYILPKVFENKELVFLTKPILVGLIFLMLGLVFAVISNQLRRQCSLVYERNDMQPPKGILLGRQLSQPIVCAVGRICMWMSVAAFFSAGMYMAICIWCALG